VAAPDAAAPARGDERARARDEPSGAIAATGIAGPATYDGSQALTVMVTSQWIAKGNTGSKVAGLEAFSVEQVG
jgi:hypothetical protein